MMKHALSHLMRSFQMANGLLLSLGMVFTSFEIAQAEVTDYIYIQQASSSPGKSLTIQVDLTNPTIAACAYQCDVVFPDGVSVLNNSIKVSSRCPNHQIASRVREDGTYRIVCYSLTNAAITGQSGTVATFDVLLSDGLSDGTYTFLVKNTEIADAASFSVNDADGHDSNLVVNANGLFGDLNHDDKVDTIDLGILINYILSSNYSGDINEDGKVDTIDLGEMINAILNH